ncbi:family 16 glycosylhydrolase [uncultured Aquimarina sp.]|uniref:family 16 glycosylhydrolase n=1 Tax=uncultured Aquimarina sp. TaxID=575652 RepID=UPI0026185E21|nr:family 16 glycosylhydrolase [uncultured Aquimarina sp.]
MKRLIILFFIIVNCTMTLYSQKKTPQPLGINGNWTIQQDFSDEFDRNINKNKWSTNIDNWPAWSSDSRKVLIKNKRLQMSIDWDKHKINGKQLYFKSGILTSKKKIKYGYFEVKMKGAPRFPGASPAFWLYSRVRNSGQNVKYVEIDCPELQSKQRDNDIISWNVVHINKNNVRMPIRQETGNGLGPSKKFHVYGYLWTAEKIEFYIDGKKIGRTVQNKFHKYAMNLIVSLGLREPYYFYDKNGVRQPVPTPDTPSKFPMTSEVEYVRV